MSLFIVFRPDQSPEEVEHWVSSEMPVGTYVYSKRIKAWYAIRHCQAIPINTRDISKEIKMMLLLMS